MTEPNTAPPAAPAPAAAPAAAPAPAQPWFSGFEPELKGFIESKGFPADEKGLAALASGYRNLEKHMGAPADQILRIPKEGDTEGWNKLYERFGRPAKPEEYELPTPEGDSGEYAKFIATAMHELGITKKQAQALAAKQNEYGKRLQQKSAEQYQNTIKEQDTALRGEWGQGYDKNIQVARGAFAELGFDTGTVDKLEKAMGFSAVMKLFYNIGSRIGEDKFVSAGGADGFGNAMSPAAAQARIDAIKGDPVLSQKYLNGDAQLKEEMDRLHRMLAG